MPYIFCTIQLCVVFLSPPQMGSSGVGVGVGVVVVEVVGLDVALCVVFWVVFVDIGFSTEVDMSSGRLSVLEVLVGAVSEVSGVFSVMVMSLSL